MSFRNIWIGSFTAPACPTLKFHVCVQLLSYAQKMKFTLVVAVYGLVTLTRGMFEDLCLADRSDLRIPGYMNPTHGDARRSLPNSPNGYVPSYVVCPSTSPSVRKGSAMSPNETQWVQKRRDVTTTSMREFLIRMNITGFDASSYIDQYVGNVSALPNVGLAFSGGGWRALMNGAGALKAFDSRTPNSTAKGHIGGLLQSATYIAGLSGGSWLVGSIYTNNFTTVTASVDDTSGSLWEFGNSIIEGPATGGIQIFSSAEYWDNIVNSAGKRRLRRMRRLLPFRKETSLLR
jgi:hypothetical protein